MIAAKAILAKVPKGNYALIGGDPGQTGATDMQAGYHDVLGTGGGQRRHQDRDGPVCSRLEGRAGAGLRGKCADPDRQRGRRVPGLLRRQVDRRHAGHRGRRTDRRLHPCHRAGHGACRDAGDRRGHVWTAASGRRRTRWAAQAAKVAVAIAQCQPIETKDTINNGVRDMPWVKTPIYYVDQASIADFVCSHDYWLNIDEVYKNVPDKKPACK